MPLGSPLVRGSYLQYSQLVKRATNELHRKRQPTF